MNAMVSMPDDHLKPPADIWSDWLLHARHGGDAAFADIVQTDVERFADRVLDAARLAPGMRLADIGTGGGVVAFRAIDRIGPTLNVLLTDISAAMLAHVESLALERGVRGQCTFLQCPADDLSKIPADSVDAVTTRAVLAYVADKPAALREFRRILKPGGRMSLAEPLMQDDALMASALRSTLDRPDARSSDRLLRLLHRWKSAQYPDTPEKIANSPIANYSERTLFEFVRTCGFGEIHLELHIDMLPSIIRSWDVFLGTSPRPWAPSLKAVMTEQFSAEESQFFENAMRPVIESPAAVTTSRIVYLSATKPA
jgi:ubiquinone/menaquinone biosynthesis C-methylase UbiE